MIENQLQKVKGIVEHFRQRTPGFPGDIVIRAPEVAALAAVVADVEELRREQYFIREILERVAEERA